MSLRFTVPEHLARSLELRAAAVRSSPEQVALAAIERELSSQPSLDEVLAPVRKAYAESGMTEDESMDLLEAEKHALRRERGAPSK